MPCSTHFASTLGSSPVRSAKLHVLKPPVWFERIAGGRTAHSTPHAETSGSATVVEHCPTHDMSWMVRSLFTALPFHFMRERNSWRTFSSALKDPRTADVVISLFCFSTPPSAPVSAITAAAISSVMRSWI